MYIVIFQRAKSLFDVTSYYGYLRKAYSGNQGTASSQEKFPEDSDNEELPENNQVGFAWTREEDGKHV